MSKLDPLSFQVHKATATSSIPLSKPQFLTKKQGIQRRDEGAEPGQDVNYDACLGITIDQASLGISCTCHLFESGIVQLDCMENCIYCGHDEASSSCASVRYTTNFTHILPDTHVSSYTTSFQYNGRGNRDETISLEKIGCNDDGMCDSCLAQINHFPCNSCTLCTDSQSQTPLDTQGFVVDCDNLFSNTSFNTCSAPPGPGVFEAFNYSVVECMIPRTTLLNDNCVHATSIVPGAVLVDTLSGANEDNVPICPTETGTMGVWYKFEGTGTPMLITTCSQSINTQTFVTVYQGSDCNILECAVGAYQDNDCAGLSYGGSGVLLDTHTNTTYFVYVSDRDGYRGSYELKLTSFPQPINDQCSAASDIVVDAGPALGTLRLHTEGFPLTPCHVPSTNNDGEAWYKFVASKNETLRASTCFDSTLGWSSAIAITHGDCDSLTCITNSELFTYIEGCGGGGNLVDFSVVAGRSYYVTVWGSMYTDLGSFELEIRSLNRPKNDLCDDAESINSNTNFTGSFIDVTFTPNESDQSCFEQIGVDTSSGGIWYTFVGSGDFVVATCCSDNFSPLITIYTGSCEELRCIVPAIWSFTDVCSNYMYGQKSLPVQTVIGQTYHLLISSTSRMATGTFYFIIRTVVPAKNDNCTEAIEISPNGQALSGNTEGATFQNFSNTCDFVSHSPDLWYVFVGSGDIMRIDTCSEKTNFDTILSLYRGNCDNLECVTTNDDGCVSLASSITWQSELLVNYYVRVQGYSDAQTGDFTLSLNSFEPAINNDCSGAIALFMDDEVTGSMEGASGYDGSYDCFTGYNQPSLWYYIDGTGTPLKLTTCSPNRTSTLSASIQIFKGTNCSDLLCEGPPYYSFVHSNDVDCDYPSITTRFMANEGIRYYILLLSSDAHAESTDTFTLRVTEFEIAENDLCDTALSITPNVTANDQPVVIIGSTSNALSDNVSCGYYDYAYYDSYDGYYASTMVGVWYSVLGTGDTLIASTCSEVVNASTNLFVFTGECDDLDCVAYGTSDNAGCDQSINGRTTAIFRTELDVVYFIFVGNSDWSSTGDFELTITKTQPPPNDLCSDAIPIIPDSGRIVGSISNATGLFGLNYDCSYGSDGPAVWYTLTGTGDVYSISTCSSELTFDSLISVSTGSCENHQCVPYVNTDYNSCTSSNHSTSRLILPTKLGVDYFIVVQAWNYVAQGKFNLKVSTIKTPPNDDCTGAIIIQPNQGTIMGSITNATGLVDWNYTCGQNWNSPSVWYSLLGTGEAFSISTCSSVSTFDSGISVSTGSCDRPECIASSNYQNNGCMETLYNTGRVVIRTKSGVEYFIAVESVGYGFEGEFGLMVSTAQVPVNNECSDAVTIDPNQGTIYGNIANATGFFGLNYSCSPSTEGTAIWYILRGTGDVYSISTCSSELSFDSALSVSTGSCGNHQCITSNAYNYDACSNSEFSTATVTFRTEVGTQYFIAVQSLNYPLNGQFSLKISTLEVPPNDDCSGALDIQPNNSPVFGSTVNATNSILAGNILCFESDSSPDLWYRVEGTGTLLTASLCGEATTYDSKIAIIEGMGDNCDTTCIISNDDFCGLASQVEWFAELDKTYFIRVYGWATSSGPFELRVF